MVCGIVQLDTALRRYRRQRMARFKADLEIIEKLLQLSLSLYEFLFDFAQKQNSNRLAAMIEVLAEQLVCSHNKLCFAFERVAGRLLVQQRRIRDVAKREGMNGYMGDAILDRFICDTTYNWKKQIDNRIKELAKRTPSKFEQGPHYRLGF